jgi:hypothetical protein
MKGFRVAGSVGFKPGVHPKVVASPQKSSSSSSTVKPMAHGARMPSSVRGRGGWTQGLGSSLVTHSYWPPCAR